MYIRHLTMSVILLALLKKNERATENELLSNRKKFYVPMVPQGFIITIFKFHLMD